MPTEHELQSRTLKEWANLTASARLETRAALEHALCLSKEQRVAWLNSNEVSLDCRQIVERLLASEGYTLKLFPAQVLQELVSRPAAMPGDYFGDWKVIKKIGYGGMGEVFLARRIEDDFVQTAALKLIPPMISNDSTQRWFRSERQNLALLGRLIDGGVANDGQQFLVMEYAAGGTLFEYCDQRRLNLRRRLALFCELCGSVEHMHREGIIHCDIKPDNVLVGSDTQVQLVDLSIARQIDKQTGNAEPTASLRYTKFYAAPEQKRSGATLTVAADVFCLGRLLEELLIGAGNMSEILEDSPITPLSTRLTKSKTDLRIAHERRTTIRQLKKSLNKRIDGILARALSHDPGLRYSTVRSLRREVTNYIATLPNPNLHGRDLIWRFWQRFGLVTITIIAAIAVISAAIGYWAGLRAG